nr:MAG TPA: hypothetical protein [Caudoviricetes sp.]
MFFIFWTKIIYKNKYISDYHIIILNKQLGAKVQKKILNIIFFLAKSIINLSKQKITNI